MSPSGYTVEVTCLSPKTTESELYDFFAFCGAIEHVDVVRADGLACAAYVTFRDAFAMETAVLLSGATLGDQHVCITRWGQYQDEFDFWNHNSSNIEGESDGRSVQGNEFVYSPGEAITRAQDVVKAMAARGYVLGKDALSKAKAFDESHQVSATAVAKVAELSERIGLTDKICAGVGTVKSVDERYHISEVTKSAVSATGRAAAAATTAVVSSSYFSKGALWMSDALTRAAKVAADLGNRGTNK